MKKMKSILCIAMVLAMAFTLIACNKEDKPDSSESPANTDSTGNTESTGNTGNAGNEGNATDTGSGGQMGDPDEYVAITIGVDSYLGRFLAGLTPAESWTGCDGVYDTVFRIDPATREPFSIILTDWGWEDDNTFVMTMRDDVYFSNGDNATAEDLIFSYFNHLERGSNYLNNFGLIWDECVTRDKYVAQFKFENPFPAFNLSSFYLLDKAWSLQVGWDSEEWYRPVGSGPYYVDEWVSDSYMVLKSRGDDYWYKDEGPIYVDEYTIKYYPDSSMLYMALEVGEVDLAANVIATDYGRFMSSGGTGYDLMLTPAGGVLFFCFSFNDTDLWYDETLREALAIGIKWDEVGQLAMEDFYIPAYSIASSISPDYVNTGAYEYNPDRAKELLAAAGYGPDNPLKISTVTMDVPMLRNGFEAFDFYAKQLGIDATIEFADVNAALSVWLAPTGTDFGFWWSVGGSPAGEVRATINEAFDPGGVSYDYVPYEDFLEIFFRMAYSTDDSVRSAAAKEIQQYMYDHYIYIPTSETSFAYGWRTDKLSKSQIEKYVIAGNNVQISRLGLSSAWN